MKIMSTIPKLFMIVTATQNQALIHIALSPPILHIIRWNISIHVSLLPESNEPSS